MLSFSISGGSYLSLKLCCHEMQSLDLQRHALTHSDTCLPALATWRKQTTSRLAYDLFIAQTRGRLRAVCIMSFRKSSSEQQNVQISQLSFTQEQLRNFQD